MRWITRSKRQPGWLAVLVHPDRIDLAHVRRGVTGRPAVLVCDSYAKEQSDAATLSRLARELRLERYRCTTLLERDDYQLHLVDAPNVPPAEMKAAVRWRVKDLIDYPVETAAVDVLDIPAALEAPTSGHSVYAVVAPQSAVERRVAAFDDSRIALESVDIPELAQRNVAALFETDGAGVVTIAFYEEDSLLTFTRAGELYNSRRIDVALADVVDADHARRTVHFERIALEVQRSLDHLGRQYHYVPLAKVLVGPVPAKLGLVDYLASIVSVPVEQIDLSEVLDVAAAPELQALENQSRYMQAIGAALRDEEGVPA